MTDDLCEFRRALRPTVAALDFNECACLFVCGGRSLSAGSARILAAGLREEAALAAALGRGRSAQECAPPRPSLAGTRSPVGMARKGEFSRARALVCSGRAPTDTELHGQASGEEWPSLVLSGLALARCWLALARPAAQLCASSLSCQNAPVDRPNQLNHQLGRRSSCEGRRSERQ